MDLKNFTKVVPTEESAPIVEESSTEKPTETQTIIEKTEKPAEGEATPATDYLGWFNTKYNTKFEKEDDIGALLTKSKQADELTEKMKASDLSLKDWEKKYKEVESKLDPMKWFKNENEFKAQQLKMRYPEHNPTVIQQIVGQDLKAMRDLDILAYKELMEDPTLTKADVEQVIRSQYEMDDEEEKPEDGVKATRMKMEANKARKALAEFSNIELPSFATPEEQARMAEEKAAEVIGEWNPYIGKLAGDGVLEIKDEEGNKILDFDISETDAKGLKEYFETMFKTAGLKPTEESLNFALEEREKILLYQNLPKILTAHKNQLKAEFLKLKDAEDGNLQPPNSKEAPIEQGKKKPTGFDDAIDHARGKTTRTIG